MSDIFLNAKFADGWLSAQNPTDSTPLSNIQELFQARQVEILLFGVYRKCVKVKLFTDWEATLESMKVM